jgi:hypothetical protein
MLDWSLFFFFPIFYTKKVAVTRYYSGFSRTKYVDDSVGHHGFVSVRTHANKPVVAGTTGPGEPTVPGPSLPRRTLSRAYHVGQRLHRRGGVAEWRHRTARRAAAAGVPSTENNRKNPHFFIFITLRYVCMEAEIHFFEALRLLRSNIVQSDFQIPLFSSDSAF